MVKINKSIGKHFIIDLWNCKCDIENIELIKNKLIELVKNLNFNIIKVYFHKFEPYGLSGIIVVSESHVAIHTYPEYDYVSLDIYTCNVSIDTDFVIKEIIDIFKPLDIKVNSIERGLF